MAQNITHRNLDVMVSAIKVQFLKPIFEDDFVERGMTAWLTGIQETAPGTWELYFDFTDFESINDKYLIKRYLPNYHTRNLPHRGDKKFTAKEVGVYRNKLTCFYEGALTDLSGYFLILGD